MKTLDYNTFYKSVDAAQMLYVHNETIKNADNLEHCKKVAREFNCLKDEDFYMNLN